LCETIFGFFFTIFFGTSAFVFTGAVSDAVTSGPEGGVPIAVATLSKPPFGTFVRVHEYVTVAPGAIDAKAGISAFVRLQFGDNGSTTCTSVKVTLPVFVTVIENVAVPPTGTVCDFGFFTIAIDGAGAGVTVNGSHAPVRPG